MASSITPQGLREALEQDRLTLLDVRRRPVYEGASDTLPGAVWCDPGEVSIWSTEVPRNTPIVVYCVHGHQVSQDVATQLDQLGYEAWYLEGGIEGWRDAGGEVELKVL
ncbi:MAG: rhodanese-like domain-containing protein [Deinococcota bacterium]|jgi:Fe-Mn family superoxide dismutase|nr:rhodanese-like domain-containing protein [Deinococcota bacterium]